MTSIFYKIPNQTAQSAKNADALENAVEYRGNDILGLSARACRAKNPLYK